MNTDMNTEKLIQLVYERPEIWNQVHEYYTCYSRKAKCWAEIAESMNVELSTAKSRWTNLRDLFRRELKKSLKAGSRKPTWRFYKSMFFLKSQIIKDDASADQSLDAFYPQTILEDGPLMKFEEECQNVDDVETSPRSSPSLNHDGMPDEHLENGRELYSSAKRPRWSGKASHHSQHSEYDDFGSSALVPDTDEDYHFVLSILPSVRRIRPDRKNLFKMKVLQLIVDEEANA